jgi:hypothetical protein
MTRMAAKRLFDVSFNNLSGPIPDSWSNITLLASPSAPASGWQLLDVSNNANMCGAIPAWYSLLAASNGSPPSQYTNGTCLPGA